MSDNSSTIVKSIVQFLRKELTSGKHDDDCAESLEVAVQCIESAYNLNDSAAGASDTDESVTDLEVLFRVIGADTIASFTKSQSEVQRLADDYKNQGNALMQLDKPQEALEQYTKAIDLYDKNAVYFCNRAAAHSKLSHHQEAIDDANRAIALDPKYSKAYGRLGIAYSNLHRFQEAKAAYTRALELEPDNRSYRNNFFITEELIRQASGNTQPVNEQIPMLNQLMINQPDVSHLPGLENINQLFRNPTVINLATQILGNAEMRDMMQGALQDHGVDGTNSMSAFMSAGQQLMEQLQAANPNLVEQIRSAVESTIGEQQSNQPTQTGDGQQPHPPPNPPTDGSNKFN